jgi:hypothetical protein
VALACWRFSFLSSSDALWRRKFENEFKITAVRENHQWTKLYNHDLPRGKKAYRSVRGKRSVVTKRPRSKSGKAKKHKKLSGENGGGGTVAKERKKRKKEQAAFIDSDAGDSDDSDSEEPDGDDIIDVDICVGRVESPAEGANGDEDRDRSALSDSVIGREKKGRSLEGDRSREKRKKRKSVDRDREGGTDISRQKRRSKERSKESVHGASQRSESVLRYCLHHRATKNDSTRWKHRYRELITDILIQRVLLKHTNRVIWGKNSIKGRSAAASELPPLKQRKSLHLLLDSHGNYRTRDQLSAVLSDPVVKSSSLSSSRDSTSSLTSEMSSAATLSNPHTPLSTSSLSTSSSVSLRSFQPALSSSSFYCPYKFRVCSQRGKLLVSCGRPLLAYHDLTKKVSHIPSSSPPLGRGSVRFGIARKPGDFCVHSSLRVARRPALASDDPVPRHLNHWYYQHLSLSLSSVCVCTTHQRMCVGCS